jgi:class 3 adenylate cyclase
MFTDIEGFTVLWDNNPDEMGQALSRHDDLLRGAVARHHGYREIRHSDFAAGRDGAASALASEPDARCWMVRGAEFDRDQLVHYALAELDAGRKTSVDS